MNEDRLVIPDELWEKIARLVGGVNPIHAQSSRNSFEPGSINSQGRRRFALHHGAVRQGGSQTRGPAQRPPRRFLAIVRTAASANKPGRRGFSPRAGHPSLSAPEAAIGSLIVALHGLPGTHRVRYRTAGHPRRP